MAKQITFNYDGKDYTLEFNRTAIWKLEAKGLSPVDLKDKPMQSVYKLFKGAFFMHHADCKDAVIDKIYGKLTNKGELFGKLTEMYSETIETLVGEPSDSEGNLTWGANW